MKCSYEVEEICCNDKSPYCTDFCPVTEHPYVCKFSKMSYEDEIVDCDGAIKES